MQIGMGRIGETTEEGNPPEKGKPTEVDGQGAILSIGGRKGEIDVYFPGKWNDTHLNQYHLFLIKLTENRTPVLLSPK